MSQNNFIWAVVSAYRNSRKGAYICQCKYFIDGAKGQGVKCGHYDTSYAVAGVAQTLTYNDGLVEGRRMKLQINGVAGVRNGAESA